jgi:hypothetical protein
LRTSSGRLLTCLLLLAIIASGLVATILSGEYRVSWWFLLVDLAESAAGVTTAAVVTRYVVNWSASRIGLGLRTNL